MPTTTATKRSQMKRNEYLTMTNSCFAHFARAYLIFEFHCSPIIEVKWPPLLLCEGGEHLEQTFSFFFQSPNHWFQFDFKIVRTTCLGIIEKYLPRNANFYSLMTFSEALTWSVLKFFIPCSLASHQSSSNHSCNSRPDDRWIEFEKAVKTNSVHSRE